MDCRELLSMLEEYPIVAAVKDREGLRASLSSQCRIVFVLFGSILNIAQIVEQIKQSGKSALVHIDLIEGLSPKEVAVDFIADRTMADGVISTKQTLIRHSKARGLITVQRFFLLDSMALSTIGKQIDQCAPDLIEVLPGCLPKIIRKICADCTTPLIAGGLLQDKEDILAALAAGATGISATRSEIWAM